MFDYDHNYSWMHSAVFESQLKAPEVYKKWSGSENIIEWITNHTFSKWQLVDLDNWMVGNPLVVPKFDPRSKHIPSEPVHQES